MCRNPKNGSIPEENMSRALDAIKDLQDQPKDGAPTTDTGENVGDTNEKSGVKVSSSNPTMAVVPETDLDVSQKD
ncbi:hypothetical protein RIF29_15188 [Crotalaria pallida]|uniref:Uncharacterized protein n=1 Tax=Crotalaria pallida TaxID=3830 RepID=A0AAN9FEQ0_CROPI